MIQLTTTRQAAQMHGIKCVAYGGSGAGKTVLCSTAPDPVIVSAESGLLSLRHLDLPTIVIKTLLDLYDAYRFITSSAEARHFQTVCLDSVTEIAETVLSDQKKKKADPRQAYGEMQTMMTDMVKGWRDLPGRHVYMASKMERSKDEASGAMLYGPMMPGRQLGPQLPYLFDEVFHLDVVMHEGKPVRFIRTARDLQYEAKDRSGALDMYEPPNLTHIFQKILAGGNTRHG